MATDYNSSRGTNDNAAKAWAIVALLLALLALGWAIRADLRAGDALEASNGEESSIEEAIPEAVQPGGDEQPAQDEQPEEENTQQEEGAQEPNTEQTDPPNQQTQPLEEATPDEEASFQQV